MEVSERQNAQVTILDVTGEIDLYNTVEIEMTIRRLATENKKLVIMNLAQAPFVDSSGLAMFLNIQKELQKVSGALKLTGLSPGLRKIFEITKLVTKLAVYDSEESALRAFNS